MRKPSPPDLFERCYEDALRIHAICINSGLPTSDAKRYTYVHVRAASSADGLKYFQREDRVAIAALKLLLGKVSLPIASLNNLPEKIRQIDTRACQNGLEYPIRYEMENRLRLHTDPIFRKQKLQFYQDRISPQIPKLTLSTVERIFQTNGKKLSQIERQLSTILER